MRLSNRGASSQRFKVLAFFGTPAAAGPSGAEAAVPGGGVIGTPAHQGIGNRIIRPGAEIGNPEGTIVMRSRLTGRLVHWG